MQSPKPDIPLGREHLHMIDAASSITRRRSAEILMSMAAASVIGSALSALYQAATCRRKCWGTGHVLESLCGRAYNLGSAAYLQITRGFYDEALSLTRGIGEIGNLVSLSIVDKSALRMWLECDAKTRRKKFSPCKVRALLKEKGRPFMYADDDWYARLSEKYIHTRGPEHVRISTIQRGDQSSVAYTRRQDLEHLLESWPPRLPFSRCLFASTFSLMTCLNKLQTK